MPAGLLIVVIATRLRQMSLERVKRRRIRDESNPTDMPECVFVTLFRLNREAFTDILRDVGPLINIGSIPGKLQLAATLRFLAVGCFQGVVANYLNISMGRTTMCRILWRVMKVLEDKLCPAWININLSEDEMRSSKLHFYEKFGFPGVIGCVDGTHIRIIQPHLDASLYYNRKGYFSINAMIICDFKMRIRAVDSCRPGSCHDSFIWGLSDAKTHYVAKRENGMRNSWLLGDSGYPLEPFLMTPFKNVQHGTYQHTFNKSPTSARNIMERTIGNLKSRFRCLQSSSLQYAPGKVVQIVNVCCALHNVCMHYNITFEEDPVPEIEVENEYDDLEEEISSNESSAIRDNIARSIMNTMRL